MALLPLSAVKEFAQSFSEVRPWTNVRSDFHVLSKSNINLLKISARGSDRTVTMKEFACVHCLIMKCMSMNYPNYRMNDHRTLAYASGIFADLKWSTQFGPIMTLYMHIWILNSILLSDDASSSNHPQTDPCRVMMQSYTDSDSLHAIYCWWSSRKMKSSTSARALHEIQNSEERGRPVSATRAFAEEISNSGDWRRMLDDVQNRQNSPKQALPTQQRIVTHGTWSTNKINAQKPFSEDL
jgi:hypothetical protein